MSAPVKAAAGVNQQINFQGRLLNAQGATVPDGYYNIQFKIYQDGDGQTAGDPGGTPKWTESYLNANSKGVEVKNGFMSVQLGSITPFGSSIDWNSDTLWLSMNIGGTNTTCTPFASCSPDGEMVPMKRMSANAYALNSALLGGLSASDFGQLTQTQTWSGANTYTGNLQIQGSGSTNVLSADTTTGTVQVGSAAPSSTANLFVLSNYSGASDPATGTNGAMYYNTSTNAFRCYTDGAWSNCGGAQGTFIQLAPSTAQIDTSTSSSVFINKTAAGNLLQLQSSGQDAFVVSGNGNVTFGSNADHTVAVATAAAGVAGNSLTISAGAGGTGNMAGGNLVLAGGAGSGTGANGSVLVKSGANDSTSAFQVQNNNGNQVFGVDTANKQATLGESGAVDGSLVFKNHSGSNTVTLNSKAVNTTYTLSLPTTSPATGLCLETSPGDANQLVFASCTNNNASIQEVHEWDANNSNTVSVSPTTAGDELVVTTQIPFSGTTVTSITPGSGGVANWTKVVASNGNGTVNRVEMWVGTVTTTGNSTITVNYSGTYGSNEITATEFTAAGVNASTSWGIESSASQLNSTADTTVTFPARTAVNGSELYVGYAQVQNPPATQPAIPTPDFSYTQTSTQHNMITYNTDLAANTSYQPVANQSLVGQSNTVAVVLTAFVTSTSINNTTSLQQANFYVQAATNGSVAGVLQAASSGTADILDLRSNGGVNVMTVGAAGDLTLSNNTSVTALQVQNASGKGVLTVDTQNNQVVLGSPNSIGGKLTFSDATDSNTISILAPNSVASSYNLALPTETPTGGLCLGTDPSNPNQLIFASCATQVSAASISYVNNWSNSGTSVTTVPDAPSSKGNLLVLYSHTASNVTINNVSGGGVTNWTKVTGNTNTTGQGNVEMWRGAVTGTGSALVAVSYSGAAGANEIAVQEFTMGSSSGTWAIDTSGTLPSSGTQTAIDYPSLTPAASSELYAGYAWSQNAMSAGTTTGFTYLPTNGGRYTVYDTNVTGGTATQPAASQATPGYYNSIGAMIAAYAGTSVIVNSTATQQANFNVQAALSGTVAGVVQGASSGTADIFQAKDGNGNNIAAVNAANGLTLGTAGTVRGQLNFAAPSNSNSIEILAPDTVGTTYQLTLPRTNPAPGQCLATDPADANKLVFSSCANQVTSIAITYVDDWNNTINGDNMSLNVSPANVGDLMIVFIAPQKSNSVIGQLSGGGVSTWSKITSTISGTGMEMWRGQVTSAGASTITATLSGATGNNDIAAYEFTTGSATGSWVVDTSNTQVNAASNTVTYPNLTPQSTKDLYVGYARAGGTMSSTGGTSGFTFTTGGFATDMGAYNTSVSTTTQPTATQSSSSASVTAGALIAAYSSSSVISNSTNTQEANFNVQAATPGSVAGVLQAAASGTQDVMRILDASGTVVDSFGSTGNLLVRPSTASASALRIQATSSANVFSVDTSANRVVIGLGSTGESSGTAADVLVLDSSDTAPAAINGAMYYDVTSQSFRCGAAGAWQNCSGLLYSNANPSSPNSNCSSSCAAFNKYASIPANYCQAGRVIKLSTAGYFSSVVGTASNLQFGVYYGDSPSVASLDQQIGVLTPAATVTSANNNYFEMNFNIICFSTSSMQAEGSLGIQVGSASSGLTILPVNSITGTTVTDTIHAHSLYLFPIWDTANASNTATLTQLTVTSP